MRKIPVIIGLVCLQMNSFSAAILPQFSAVYDPGKKAIVIKWQQASADVKTYVIQQSNGNAVWTDIALEEVNRSSEKRSFYFEYKKISPGENHYRLKCIYLDGRTECSPDVLVIAGALGKSWVMYPVRVTDMLTLEYRGTEKIKGVIHVLIQQPMGRVFTKLRCASLSRQIRIPVENLPKGIYDIRIIVQDEVIWDQRFVK